MQSSRLYASKNNEFGTLVNKMANTSNISAYLGSHSV